MPISLIAQFVPWFVFFTFIGYRPLELKIGVLTSLVLLLVLRLRSLKQLQWFDLGGMVFFFAMTVLLFFFYRPWLEIYADCFAGAMLSLMAWGSWLQDRPFTKFYTQACIKKEFWVTSLFRQLDQKLTLVWSGAFTLLTIVFLVKYLLPVQNIWLGEILPLMIVLATVLFMFWFPGYYKQRHLGHLGIITLTGLSDIHYIETETAKISYRTLGQGKTLVLLPNSNMTMYGWDPEMLERLAKTYRLVLLDYPGVGESVWKVTPANLTEMSEAIYHFVDMLNVRQTILLGFTMGAWIAQKIAIQHPESVQGLVLIAADVGGSRAIQPASQLSNILHDTEGDIMQQTEIFLDTLFSAQVLPKVREKMLDISRTASWVRYLPGDTVRQQLQLSNDWYAGDGSYQQLSRIRQPTLIVAGVLDKIVHRQNSLLLANGIYDSKLLEYAHAGHGVMYQYATVIADEIIEYFHA